MVTGNPQVGFSWLLSDSALLIQTQAREAANRDMRLCISFSIMQF